MDNADDVDEPPHLAHRLDEQWSTKYILYFTTLAGLVGGILLRTQYYLLDEANEELFSNIAQISETKIIPIIINSK